MRLAKVMLVAPSGDSRKVEDDAARICAELKCPHPYIGMESLSGTHEAWWLNAFASESEKQEVAEDYAKNAPLMSALNQIVKRKEGLSAREWIAADRDFWANQTAR